MKSWYSIHTFDDYSKNCSYSCVSYTLLSCLLRKKMSAVACSIQFEKNCQKVSEQLLKLGTWEHKTKKGQKAKRQRREGAKKTAPWDISNLCYRRKTDCSDKRVCLTWAHILSKVSWPRENTSWLGSMPSAPAEIFYQSFCKLLGKVKHPVIPSPGNLWTIIWPGVAREVYTPLVLYTRRQAQLSLEHRYRRYTVYHSVSPNMTDCFWWSLWVHDFKIVPVVKGGDEKYLLTPQIGMTVIHVWCGRCYTMYMYDLAS